MKFFFWKNTHIITKRYNWLNLHSPLSPIYNLIYFVQHFFFKTDFISVAFVGELK